MRGLIVILIVFSTPFVFADEVIEWRMGDYVYEESSRCYPEPFEGCALPKNFSCDGLGNGQCVGNDGKLYLMLDLSDVDKEPKDDVQSEFGVIASLILAVAMISIIAVSIKVKMSNAPRY